MLFEKSCCLDIDFLILDGVSFHSPEPKGPRTVHTIELLKSREIVQFGFAEHAATKILAGKVRMPDTAKQLSK